MVTSNQIWDHADVADAANGVGWSRFLVVLTNWRDVGHREKAWCGPLRDAGRRGRTHDSCDLRRPLIIQKNE
jgi:hypothetical protein